MDTKTSFSLETELSIRKACDSIIMRNNAELLLELWNQGLISDEFFIKHIRYKTSLPVSLCKKEDG